MSMTSRTSFQKSHTETFQKTQVLPNAAPIVFTFAKRVEIISVRGLYTQTNGDTNGRFQLIARDQNNVKILYCQCPINLVFGGMLPVFDCDIYFQSAGATNGVGSFNNGFNNQLHGVNMPFNLIMESGWSLEISIFNNAAVPASYAATSMFKEIFITAGVE